MTRRDKCFKSGTRMIGLNGNQGAYAWFRLAGKLIALGDKDVPKFKDLMEAMEKSIKEARKL
jgi:hypothetical protein